MYGTFTCQPEGFMRLNVFNVNFSIGHVQCTFVTISLVVTFCLRLWMCSYFQNQIDNAILLWQYFVCDFEWSSNIATIGLVAFRQPGNQYESCDIAYPWRDIAWMYLYLVCRPTWLDSIDATIMLCERMSGKFACSTLSGSSAHLISLRIVEVCSSIITRYQWSLTMSYRWWCKADQCQVQCSVVGMLQINCSILAMR